MSDQCAPVGTRRSPVRIRLATLDDAPAIRAIYNFEVENHTTTFDLVPRTIESQRTWLAERSGAFAAVVATLTASQAAHPPDDGAAQGSRHDEMRIPHHNAPTSQMPDTDVAELVVGFASLSPYKERAAYRPTVENSVYVSRDHGGQGIGRALMEHLIAVARDSGFHSMIARIEASSDASLALHRACDFRLIGVEHEVGRKFNRWLSTASMQLML